MLWHAACWHLEPVWACTPWHGLEAFHQCKVPYLTSLFRYTSHTPTSERENYMHSRIIHIQDAESNPPTIHTHSPAITHNRHTYFDTAAQTQEHITGHKQSCGFTNATSGGISHPATFCSQVPGPNYIPFSSNSMKYLGVGKQRLWK